MKIYFRKNVIDFILREKSYCIKNSENQIKLIKVIQKLEIEGIKCAPVIHGCGENYYIEGFTVEKESPMILAKKSDYNGHWYQYGAGNEIIRNVEGLEVVKKGFKYFKEIRGVLVEFELEGWYGSITGHTNNGKIQKLPLTYETKHIPTDWVYVHNRDGGEILSYSEYQEILKKNIEIEEKRKTLKSPWNSTIEKEFGITDIFED